MRRHIRHAGYVTRNALTEAEQAEYRRLADEYRRRLGPDSPLLNSPAFAAGLRARIVRERTEPVTAGSVVSEGNQREEASR